MVKKIVLEMNENKDIVIYKDNVEKINIKKDERKINANKIFELFDHNIGDKYEIEINNPNNYDIEVVSFFYDMLVEIQEKIEEISIE